MAEVRHALAEKNSAKAEEELGDLLFAAVNLARFVQVDPESALKKANAKFQRRFMGMEQTARDRAKDFAQLPREEMEALWDSVKHHETKSPQPPAARAIAANGSAASDLEQPSPAIRPSKNKAAATPSR
jgi:hypothetical protein